MASNALPDNTGQLIELGNHMLAGLTLLGTTLKITQITPAEFEADLTAFINADNDFNTGRSAQQVASEASQAAIAAIAAWLGNVRGVLTASFGPRWNTSWAQAGFIPSSTAVPRIAKARIALASRLVAFFTAQPSYEVASLEVTAAKGTALVDTAQAAIQALAAQDVSLGTVRETWDGAYGDLTVEMRDLIKLLSVAMEDNDPRWLSFGLNIPAAHTTPAQPQNVSAHTDDTGAIVVQCDAVPLASRYRWRMMFVGVETNYRLATSSVAPIGTIPDVQPGQLVQIIVQAVNGTQQGVASEPLKFRMPPAQNSAQRRTVEVHASAGPQDFPDATGNGKGDLNVAGLTHRLPTRSV